MYIYFHHHFGNRTNMNIIFICFHFYIFLPNIILVDARLDLWHIALLIGSGCACSDNHCVKNTSIFQIRLLRKHHIYLNQTNHRKYFWNLMYNCKRVSTLVHFIDGEQVCSRFYMNAMPYLNPCITEFVRR